MNFSLDDAVDFLYFHMYSAIERFIPKRLTSHSKYPRWFSPGLKRLIFAKKAAHARYKRSNRFEDYLGFSNLRVKCQRIANSFYCEYVSNVESQIIDNTNTNAFWGFVNSKR